LRAAVGNGYVFLGSTDTFQGWFNAFPSAAATGHVIIGGNKTTAKTGSPRSM
jgi:hypothetical protein